MVELIPLGGLRSHFESAVVLLSNLSAIVRLAKIYNTIAAYVF